MAAPVFPRDPEPRQAGVVVCEGQRHGVTASERLLGAWLEDTARDHGRALGSLTYVLLSDDELLELNRRYLAHDTLTDIITFDGGEGNAVGGESAVDGECYISVDRVRENARVYGQPAESELLRVMVHGLLHLCGFADGSTGERLGMRQAENRALTRVPPGERLVTLRAVG